MSTIKAADLWRKWTGKRGPGKVVGDLELPDLSAVAVLGRVDAIDYTGRVAGELAPYRHAFKGANPAVLCGVEGTGGRPSVLLILGDFRLTARGIVDRRGGRKGKKR